MDSTTRHSTPFVGRRDELALLREQFDLVTHDGPRLVLLSAPAGTGKTALVRHFLHTVQSRCTAATGRGWDNRAAVAYHALREALLQIPRSQEPPPSPIRAFLDGPTGQEKQILDPKLPVSALLDVLFGMLRRIFTMWIYREQKGELIDQSNLLFELVWRAIVNPNNR